MWVQTTHGHTSTVAKGPSERCVRARDRESLEHFCDLAGISRRKIHSNFPSDYPFRVNCTQRKYERFLVMYSRSIDYPNFKTRVGQVLGHKSPYLDFLHAVWAAGLKLTPRSVVAKNDNAWTREHPTPMDRRAEATATLPWPDTSPVQTRLTLEGIQSLDDNDFGSAIALLIGQAADGDEHAAALLDEVDDWLSMRDALDEDDFR